MAQLPNVGFYFSGSGKKTSIESASIEEGA
jgi:hypothetical protein